MRRPFDVYALFALVVLFATKATAQQPLPRWGNSQHDSCSLPGTWEELADREARSARPYFGTGGLGALEDLPRFRVWLCEDDHACAPEGANNTAFCFVFDETNKVFIPWGADADLEVWHRPPPPPCDLACLLERKPVHSAYYGSEYDSSNGRLPDVSGNARHAQVADSSYFNFKSGVEVRAGHGATADVVFYHAEKNVLVEWPDNSIPETFTVCSVTRWASPDPDFQKRILTCGRDDTGTNWYQGHHGIISGNSLGRGSAYYHDGYKQSDTIFLEEGLKTDPLDWLVTCGTNNASIPAPGNLVVDQTEVGVANGGIGNCKLNINGRYTQAQQSEFGFYSLLIWDQGLTPEEMKLVTKAMRDDLMGAEETSGCTHFGVACARYTALDQLKTVLAAHPPHSVYYASEYDAQNKVLPDLTGNGRDASGLAANVEPRLFTATGHGAEGEVAQLMGTHKSSFLWPGRTSSTGASIPVTFTICSVSRWTHYETLGTELRLRRLLGCRGTPDGNVNWLHGHHWATGGKSGGGGGRGSVFYSRSDSLWGATYPLPEDNDEWYGTGRDDWVVLCGTNGVASNNVPQNQVMDWYDHGHARGGTGNCQLSINYDGTSTSNWALYGLYVWDKEMSNADMKTVARALRNDLMGTAFPSICAFRNCTGQIPSTRLSPAERSRPSAAVTSFMQQHPPHSAYYGGQYDSNTDVLPDVSGNGRDAALGAGATAPTVTEALGKGSNRRLATIVGNTDTVINFPEGSIPAEFTICSATRWTGAGDRKRVLQCAGGTNWLHGHSAGDRAAMFYGNKYVYKRLLSNTLLDGAGQDDWLVLCGTNNPNAQHSAVYADVYPDSSSQGGTGDCQLTINGGNDPSAFEMYSVFVWDKFLTTDEMVAFNKAIVEDMGMYLPFKRKNT